jgi:hypothetical protein
MAFIVDDRVRETTTIVGTGPVTTLGAPNGFQSFGSVMSVGDTTWYAIVQPGGNWETGIATYTASNTLARTTVISSSNAGSLVSFPVGSKDVFITQPAKKAQPFPSGTLMLFQQSAAPPYWTKQTTHNDKALRVVSGAASYGGTNAFSTVNNQSPSVGNTTISVSTMGSHTHPYTSPAPGAGTGTTPNYFDSAIAAASTGSIGGDGAHNHPITIAFAVQYVDLIIASKD